MSSTWPRTLVLLLLVLTAAAGYPTLVDTRVLQCFGVEEVTKANPVFFPLDEQASRSLQFSFPTGRAWDAVFTLGEGPAESFTERVHLEIRKGKPKAQLAVIKANIIGGKKELLLNSRVDSSWLEGDGQATLFYGDSALSITFVDGDSKFLQLLSDPQFTGLNSISVKGDLQVKECEGPGHVQDTSAATTTTTTSEPITDTSAADASTTAATTKSPTITPSAAESTAFTTEDTSNATVTNDNLPQPCAPAGNTDADYNVGAACPTSFNDSVIGLGGSVQCVEVPRWAWACAGLSVVFFVFIVGLIIYSITLYKRSWRHGKALQSSGGYGMSAQDMHYYAMGNNNLMIGSTVPRIGTPRHSSVGGLTPRHSINRVSHSLPTSRSTTPFPSPPENIDLENSTTNILDQKEKSRSSKVSFAEE